MEKIYERVENLLEFIREQMEKMNLDAEQVFLNGNCGNLYKIFVSKFSKFTTPFLIRYEQKPIHIITKIGEKFYDITGETSLEKYIGYVRERNSNRVTSFEDKDFTLEQLSVANPLLNKMCDMYRYNEEYEQSEIDYEMHKLTRLLNGRDESQK